MEELFEEQRKNSTMQELFEEQRKNSTEVPFNKKRYLLLFFRVVIFQIQCGSSVVLNLTILSSEELDWNFIQK